MDTFRDNLKLLPREQKLQKLDQVINFLRSNNSPKHADAFTELKNCYPSFPFFKDEEAFRVYLAWFNIAQLPVHGPLSHILRQG
jgi:hypothetical protein